MCSVDIGVLFMISSISLMGMGLFRTIQESNYFDMLIYVTNIIAWIIALFTTEE